MHRIHELDRVELREDVSGLDPLDFSRPVRVVAGSAGTVVSADRPGDHYTVEIDSAGDDVPLALVGARFAQLRVVPADSGAGAAA